MRQIMLATFMAAGWAGTASAACTYEQGKRRPCPIDFHGSVTLMERRVSL